jgi:hypothetical protein
VISAWKSERLGTIPAKRVRIVGPLPKKLQGTIAPQYFWIDGTKLRGALLDFKASGFVGVKFCTECATRSHNIGATYDRQNSAVWPYVFRDGTWAGLNLFTTDLSQAAFFCTEKLLEIARKYRLTNFRFIPVEEGDGVESRGLK